MVLMKKGTAFRNIGHKNECSFRCLISLVLSHLHLLLTMAILTIMLASVDERTNGQHLYE